MAKKQKGWIYAPQKPAAPKVPTHVKTAIEAKAQELIDSTLKPEHIKPPPENKDWNYIVDIYGKWYRNYFYFCAKYHSPSPNAIQPYFEIKFARLEYAGIDSFNLSYFRHTGQFWEVYQGVSLEGCLKEIRENPIFQP